MNNLLAAKDVPPGGAVQPPGGGGIPIGPPGGFKGFGPLGLEGGQSAILIFTKFLSSVVGLLTVVAFIWFVFKFITGAIGIIAAGGDKQKLESSRNSLTTGIVGLIVVIAAIFVIDLFGYIFGIPAILSPTQWIKFLEIK